MVSVGNVSIEEFLARTGYNMSADDIATLIVHRQDDSIIDGSSDKFHIFDSPFSIVVGSKFRRELTTMLIKYEEQTPSKEGLAVYEIL